MTTRTSLLQILADGHFHSGEILGSRLGVSRAAIWKHLRAFKSQGLVVYAVRGRGYRLEQPIEFLDTELIKPLLSESAHQQLSWLDVLTDTDSTNNQLKILATHGAPSGRVCLAEYQRAGRGRHGRQWVSPFAANVYVSLLWRFTAGPAALAGLSLAVGVALARAVQESVGPGLGLKWPNDLVYNGHKLGGILLEIAGEASGPSYAIIGIGLNVRMPANAVIDQSWTDMHKICAQPPSRNALTAAILTQLVSMLQEYEKSGLAAFMDAWRSWDVTVGKAVQLHLSNNVITGRAQGIADDGAILIQVDNQIRRYASGEISLRIPT